MTTETTPARPLARSTRPRIGRYHVLGMLGRGGMAEVSLVVASEHDESRKPLVAKRVLDELADEPDMLRMFLDEARLALRLNHPNVVQSFEADTDQGVPFLVMEYLAGQPLNRLLHYERQHPASLPLAMKLQMACDWLRGLHYAHELRDYDGTPLHVVHRDVSPQNLFVTYEGVAKVVDFGIAKAAGRSHRTITGLGGPKGKVRYMAPEQARGERVDARADVFAIGTVLLELVNGQRSWPAHLDDMSILAATFQGQLPPVELAPFVPPSLGPLLARARAVDPDDRFPSAAAFREAIEAEMAALGLGASQGAVGQWMQEHFAGEQQKGLDRIREGFAGLAPAAPGASDESPTSTLPVAPGPWAAPPPERTWSRRAPLAAAAAAALGAWAVWTLLSAPPAPRAEVAATSTPPAPPAPPASAAGPPPAASAAASAPGAPAASTPAPATSARGPAPRPTRSSPERAATAPATAPTGAARPPPPLFISPR